MSDDEYYEEETKSNTSKKGDEAFAKAKAGIKKSELDEQLKEYINEWRWVVWWFDFLGDSVIRKSFSALI